jgi:thymidylate synthase
MNNLDQQYLDLLDNVMRHGNVKQDRTGTGTRSLFGKVIRHDMSEGFPILTTKKVAWKQVVTELLWLLSGSTNIKPLVDNGNNIWNGDAIKNYEKHNGEIDWGPLVDKQEVFINMILTDDEFAKKWGELGPIYGKQWRDWNGVDQIQNLIDNIKTNPDSRRLMVNALNVGDLRDMVLPPCHYAFQVYTEDLYEYQRLAWYCRQKSVPYYHDHMSQELDHYNVPTRGISMMVNIRSSDIPLGLPFNISSYGLLLDILGNMTNLIPRELIIVLGDAHVYLNQKESASIQLTRQPKQLPVLSYNHSNVRFDGSIDDFLQSCTYKDFILKGYEPHPTIKFPLSN